MKEKQGEYRLWKGDMEADYIYTSGVAGDRFFKTLRDKGMLSATYCPNCDITYMPPRMYCENCFGELDTWKELSPEGSVDTFTIAHVDEKDKKLEIPRIWAFIRIDGANGGLIHNLKDIDPSKVQTGMKVKAVLKPKDKRTGEITDIECFRTKN